MRYTRVPLGRAAKLQPAEVVGSDERITMNTLYLAWQDPLSRRWFTIGRLTTDEGGYRFVYTQGAREAQQLGQFQPLSSFPNLDGLYWSDELFPLFSNRLLRPSRPDYREFTEWLDCPGCVNDPIALLARSGGQRGTDLLQVFASPQREASGEYRTHFFVHGLSHLPAPCRERAETRPPATSLRWAIVRVTCLPANSSTGSRTKTPRQSTCSVLTRRRPRYRCA